MRRFFKFPHAQFFRRDGEAVDCPELEGFRRLRVVLEFGLALQERQDVETAEVFGAHLVVSQAEGLDDFDAQVAVQDIDQFGFVVVVFAVDARLGIADGDQFVGIEVVPDERRGRAEQRLFGEVDIRVRLIELLIFVIDALQDFRLVGVRRQFLEDALDDVAAHPSAFLAVVTFAGFVGRAVKHGEVVVVEEQAVFANGVVFLASAFFAFDEVGDFAAFQRLVDGFAVLQVVFGNRREAKCGNRRSKKGFFHGIAPCL